MPIEIKEMHIKIKVDSDAPPTNLTPEKKDDQFQKFTIEMKMII